MKRNLGKEYTTTQQGFVPAKQCDPDFDCK